MHNNISLITTVVAALGFGLIFGYLAVRLKLPALVGYLAAGVLIGPATPGIVADTDLAAQLAEIGVMLMMFGVGLHFSVADLWQVRRIALPGALLQIGVTALLGMALAEYWGWGMVSGLVFGLALSVASTVVLLRALEERGVLPTLNGRVAIGWLVVEDLVMVLILVLLPPLARVLDGASSVGLGPIMAWTLAKVGLFLMLMLIVGRRLFPWLLRKVEATGSRELFTLCVVTAAVGIAYGSTELFGVSFALGAFFAGMVLRESELSHRAAQESLPLREAFAVLFFVSIGMLFDPSILLHEPLRVLAVVAVIMLCKSVAAYVLVRVLGYPGGTALTVSASLAQIGEFSFVLTGLGVSLGLLPDEGQNLILAGAIASITLNPLMYRLNERLERWLFDPVRREKWHNNPSVSAVAAPLAEGKPTRQVVLVGYGAVGNCIAQELAKRNIIFVVVEKNRDRAERLRLQDGLLVAGHTSEAIALAQAHIAYATALVLVVPDSVDASAMIDAARELNPAIQTVVLASNETDAFLLQSERAEIFTADGKSVDDMAEFVLDGLNKEQ